MSNDTSDTDGDGRPASATFDRVDWEEIDSSDVSRPKKRIVWFGVVGAWTLGLLYDLYSRFVAETGPAEFPFIGISAVIAEVDSAGAAIEEFPFFGTVAAVDWLWSMTILLLLYYGVVPLYENKRMTKYYWKEFKKNTAAVISGLFLVVIFLVGVIGSRILPAPEPTPGMENQPPVWSSIEAYTTGNKCPGGTTVEGGVTMCQGSWQHPLGTTSSGEDILLASIHGMEVSMQVGLIATMMSISIAAVVGLTAAYYGGLIDEVLMRYVDIQMTFPTFFLFLLLAYTFSGSLFVLILIFGLFGWGSSARIMRSEALQRREEPYMKAAKNSGASSFWTIRRHLLPNVSNSLITAATLTIPTIILAEAAIAFLGLGDPTVPSWGRLIAGGRDQLSDAWWISTIPGVFLFFTILAFNFLGDALRDALDPRHGGSGE
ncbi:ABC transporter permease [Natronorubrum halophilum]|uniref:ABC transporter permease n=1 Tax=Natronorubrum halophilum TaxID=1702106 RepID=UPI0010C178F1|nr:ABC transporter permease subunit [Natronorubrum halophilum]